MQNNIRTFDIKINLAGDSDAGKTSLMNRQVDNDFSESFRGTIGCDFKKKTYNFGNQEAKTMIWDQAGAQRYKSIRAHFYKNAHSVLFCFDLCNKISFMSVYKFVKQMQQYGIQTSKCYLVGCKSDLEPQVTMEDIHEVCSKLNFTYFQTSAKQNYGVHEIFSIVVTEALNREKENPVFTKKNVKLLLQRNKKGYCY